MKWLTRLKATFAVSMLVAMIGVTMVGCGGASSSTDGGSGPLVEPERKPGDGGALPVNKPPKE